MAPEPGARSRRQPGFALVIVLWAVVLLTALATQLTATGSMEVRLAANLRGAAVAQAAADGVVQGVVFGLLARPGPWPPNPAPRTERVAAGVATIRLDSEDGKVDLNSAPAGLLAGVLRGIGLDAAAALRLATDITLWRFPSAATTDRAFAYAQAGLSYAPPGAPFQSVGEVSLVLGMTPAIYAALRPHVTVFREGDPDPTAADAVVRVAMGLPPEPVGAAPQPVTAGVRVAVIDVEVETPQASRASRHAVVRVGAASDRGGWVVLDWN